MTGPPSSPSISDACSSASHWTPDRRHRDRLHAVVTRAGCCRSCRRRAFCARSSCWRPRSARRSQTTRSSPDEYPVTGAIRSSINSDMPFPQLARGGRLGSRHDSALLTASLRSRSSGVSSQFDRARLAARSGKLRHPGYRRGKSPRRNRSRARSIRHRWHRTGSMPEGLPGRPTGVSHGGSASGAGYVLRPARWQWSRFARYSVS